MKKRNVIFALLLGAVASFTSCSKDDDLTPEEIEAKEKQELVAEITTNFETITTTQWAFKEFQPSDDLLAASETEDGAVAKTQIMDAKHAKNFNMVLTFSADGEVLKPSIAMNVPEEELETKVLAYLNEPWGFELYTELSDNELKSYLAQFRRVIAAPLAADDLGTDDITSEETGLCIFSISMRDFSELSYDDTVLAQKKLIEGNSDKIYINADGTLTVETTSTDYGVSKLILEEVK